MSETSEAVVFTTNLKYVKRDTRALLPVVIGKTLPTILIQIDPASVLAGDAAFAVTFGGGEDILAPDAPGNEQAPAEYLDALAEMLDVVKDVILQAKAGGLAE